MADLESLDFVVVLLVVDGEGIAHGLTFSNNEGAADIVVLVKISAQN